MKKLRNAVVAGLFTAALASQSNAATGVYRHWKGDVSTAFFQTGPLTESYTSDGYDFIANDTIDYWAQVSAFITHDSQGYQTLAFVMGNPRAGSDLCTDVSSSFITVNGQAVRVNPDCLEREVTGKKAYRHVLLPKTRRGLEFIVNELKKAPKNIEITYGGHSIKLSSKGFTKAWDDFGGDAL